MPFKVFISHSTADLGLVQQLQYWLQVNGIETYLADLYPQPGINLAATISKAIEDSNCVIAVLTQDGTRSQWVHQEIGYANRARKLIIPIVEIGVPPTGFIQGIHYIPFSKENPTEAVNSIVTYIKKLKTDKESQEIMMAGLLILIGLLALASSRE